MADLKVHLRKAGEEYFYYPDVMVACLPDDTAVPTAGLPVGQMRTASWK
jgi:hypothetical protein